MNTLTAVAAPSSGISEFKLGVDALLEKRRYFIEKILPTLVQGKDFFVIKGRRSLGKAGAEKLASLFQLVAVFWKDIETMESFKTIDGLVAYKCTLTKNGVIVAEGRGAAVLKEHNGCPNTTIKLCEKRAFVSAIIRATGLSDLFSQDLEDMPLSAIQPSGAVMTASESEASLADDHYDNFERAEQREEENEMEPEPITDKQKEYLYSLAMQNLDESKEKEEYLANIESLSKSDACSSIRAMLATVSAR
ncbi:MAG: hypothetical protein Q8R36_00635 [bacterium]|nr:hypothetical protein [bacterium]